MTRSNLATLILSSVIAVYFAEIALSLGLAEPDTLTREERAEQAGVAFDDRTKFEVVRDLRAQGKNAYPGIHLWLVTQALERDAALYPLSGAAGKLTVFGNESGRYVTYVSDPHGFNNAGEVWQGSPSVALVGDSFVQGAYVAPKDNIAGRLSANGVPVINLGIVGAGPLIQLGIIKEYAAPLQPPKVVWFYYEGNDLLDLRRERRFSLLRKYLTPDFSQGLIDRQQDLDAFLSAYLEDQIAMETAQHQVAADRRAEADQARQLQQAERRSFGAVISLSNFRGLLTRSSNTVAQARRTHDTSHFEDALNMARNTVEAWGGQMYFAYLPAWERYGLPGQTSAESAYREEILSIVSALGLPCIDLVATFNEFDRPVQLFPFQMPGHYTEEGYAIVADAVRKAISPGNEAASGDQCSAESA